MASLSFQAEKSKKKRTRIFTPEDRASHRLIEKQRRESLNESFLELARLVPELAQVRQLSKSIIVNKSIAHLRSVRAMNLAAAPEIRSLLAEYESLLAEVNVWRSLNDQNPRPLLNFTGGSSAIEHILNAEQEKFGTFPQGFDENRSKIQPVEAGDVPINGFGTESQHRAILHNSDAGLGQDKNSLEQPPAANAKEAGMQTNDDMEISYFVGDHEDFDFHDPDSSLFTIPPIGGQMPFHMPGFDSHLFGLPELTEPYSASHRSL